MLSATGKIIFAFVILATAVAFALPVIRRIRIIVSGLPEKRFNSLIKRFWDALKKILFQRCTLRRERILSGFMHVFIFYSALTFDTMTVNHTLEGFFPHFYMFGSGNFGLFFSLLVDIMAVLVLIGILFFAFRRFVVRPKAYRTTLLDSAVIYFALTAVTLSYMYFEIFSIAAHPGTERLSFLGIWLGKVFQTGAMSPAAIQSQLHIGWWLHILLVYAFIAYVPYSKYFHMFAGSFNVLVRSRDPLGELHSLDLEKTEVFGVEKATDYTWKDLLDAFACMECGRCQDACPAFASEKPLSPKMIIFNLKAHLLSQTGNILHRKREDMPPLMADTFTEEEMWTCTTCGACVNVCPVEIEHIRKIVGVRQGQVLMESKFPQELNAFFRNMETNSNPWGIGFADRAAWTEGLDVKLISEHPEAEYLFWVGCAGSFDEQGRNISRAMVKILKAADLDFAILGTEEKCCGDSAKRLGNEYLFQMQAAENIELFKKHKIKRIITACPHGFNTFKNEYTKLCDILPDKTDEDRKWMEEIEVLHYTELLDRLIKEGRLKPKKIINRPLTYHDSCYLGRHNRIFRQPRSILSSLSDSGFQELGNSGPHSFCCGAGGGLMWTEESLGIRINHLRTDEVIQSGVEQVATSCPFCLTMLRDGLKDKEKEGLEVKDIAQLVAEALD
jgi:Fe-S oxidoreductase/nitrate reductase gamma subunit